MNTNEDQQALGILLQDVLDVMLEGFQVVGSDWRYRFVNETVARQGRSTKGELIGRTMMECYPGIENSEVYAQCKKCMETQESIRMENQFIFPGGEVGWFDLYIHPITDGFLMLSVDMTAKKNAEDALKEKIHDIGVLMNSTTDREVKLSQLREEVECLRQISEQKTHTV